MDYMNRDAWFQHVCTEIAEEENKLKDSVNWISKWANTESAASTKKRLDELNQ